MKYSIVGSGSYATLFDESAGAQVLEEFAPKFAVKVQEDALAGGTASFRNPLGNVSAAFNLKFNQGYSTLALALTSIRTFGATLLNVKLHLQIQQDAEVQYYPNAVVSAYSPIWRGTAVDHIFNLKSDSVTNSAP